MNLQIPQLPLATAKITSTGSLHPLPTPPLESDTPSEILLSTSLSTPTNFPIKVAILPNKGRSYVASRKILPGELVFVAEAFGTTMCDPWLDCGICHYCWSLIQDRKAQIRLPSRKQQLRKQHQETVMVFCDSTCLDLYGSGIAGTICQVEHNVRRVWNAGVASSWKIVLDVHVKAPLEIAGSPHGDKTASTLFHEALALASTGKGLLGLDDPQLEYFLDCTWSAIDILLAAQEAKVLATLDSTTSNGRKNHQQQRTKILEALYPSLALQLLTGDNDSEIAAKTSDDDCETIRLVTDIILRRQLEQQGLTNSAHSGILLNAYSEIDYTSATRPGQATFADYCAMQSNETVLVRQAMSEEAIANESQDSNDSLTATGTDPWSKLLSILPSHLLNCLYVYLRIRDAYFLLSHSPQGSPSSTHSLPMNHPLFRTILYREVANSFGIRDRSDELLGFAIFPKASFFNHSCRPNIEKHRRQTFKARQMEYWSTQEIEAGQECCISYGDIAAPLAERQVRLLDMYFFTCSCPRCLEESLIDISKE